MLFAAVREVSPHRPLAAGLAAAILGTMAGLTGVLSQVQNDALLLPLCVATFWLLARDLRRRRVGLLLPLVAGATIVTQLIAGPAAVAAVVAGLCGDARLRGVSWRSREVLRVLVTRLAAFAVLPLPWVTFNLYEYHWLWPIVRGGDGGGAGGAVTGDPGLYRHFIELMHAGVLGVMGGLWLQIWPVQNLFVATDLRPAAVIAFAGGAALVAGLWSGSLLRERRRLAFWAGVMLVSFLGVFVVLLANASSAHGPPDFVARYFVAFAAAYAAFVGTAVGSISDSRPWVARACSCGVGLVLAWMMLDVAYPGVVG
jgi:4-amino-4-deoxy-L-arabinose transferase-like glycosyltransferase